MSIFKDRVVMITGGSMGIGRATALEFAARGASVVIAARGIEGEKAVEAEIIQAGGDALYVQADMAKASDIKALISETVSHYGRLDHTVNNAAAEVVPALISESSESDVYNTLNVYSKRLIFGLSQRTENSRSTKFLGMLCGSCWPVQYKY